jgi:diketogulonate reductase-like aldo/keto reductase
MAKLKKAGFIKHIGVSNFDVELLKEAIKVSPEPISFNQVLYNIVDKNPEKELLPLCQENDVNLTAYSPLKRGTLPSGVKTNLKEIALKYNSTIYQVMLAWLLSKERVIAIPKASSPDHLQENLNAADLKLNPEDIEKLNKLTS